MVHGLGEKKQVALHEDSVRTGWRSDISTAEKMWSARSEFEAVPFEDKRCINKKK